MTLKVDKYSPVYGKTITLEFYIDVDKVLHVIYNMNNYTFSKFWSEVEHSDELCRIIYNQFDHNFPLHMKNQNTGSKNWMETFIKFINSHLGKYDRKMDVVIRSNGSVEVTLEN